MNAYKESRIWSTVPTLSPDKIADDSIESGTAILIILAAVLVFIGFCCLTFMIGIYCGLGCCNTDERYR